MFAYCNNDPTNRIDKTGTDPISAIIGVGSGSVVGIAVGFALGFSITQELVTNLVDEVVNAYQNIDNLFERIRERVAASVSRSANRNEQLHDHHIVAQSSPNAEVAREVLKKVGISVDSGLNRVPIRATTHQRLHTAEYYLTVNTVIVQAYLAGGTSPGAKKANVTLTLLGLRAAILALDSAMPY